MRIKIAKCEARNAVNIENIDKFRNEAVGGFKLMGAGHDLFRGSLNQQCRFLVVAQIQRGYILTALAHNSNYLFA